MKTLVYPSEKAAGSITICGIPVEETAEIRKLWAIQATGFFHVSEYDRV